MSATISGGVDGPDQVAHALVKATLQSAAGSFRDDRVGPSLGCFSFGIGNRLLLGTLGPRLFGPALFAFDQGEPRSLCVNDLL